MYTYIRLVSHVLIHPTLYQSIPNQACAFWQTMMAEVRAHAQERQEFEARLRRIEADCGVKEGTLDGAFVCGRACL